MPRTPLRVVLFPPPPIRLYSALIMSNKPRRYRCTICEHIYDPAEGDPMSNIPPGTPFEAISDSWSCPDCNAVKADFEPMED